MLVQAATFGMGVALVPRFLVQEELTSGTLSVPLEPGLKNAKAYYLVFPEKQADAPPLAAFRAWLQTETRAYQEGSGTTVPSAAPGRKLRRARHASEVNAPEPAAPARANRQVSRSG